jgi:precorrin-2/cobalt-factor-2 C20-methyltransferase
VVTAPLEAAAAVPAGAGTLYGVGVGPGDPELITVKAVRILRAVPVAAHFAKRGAVGNASTTAMAYLSSEQTLVRLEYPITVESPPVGVSYADLLHRFYDRSARQLAEHLEAGRDVAVLCEGDPLFFGSFMYLHDRLAGCYPTQVVAGVTSVGAASAVLGKPLTRRNDEFRVLVGISDEDELVSGLAGADAAVVMKLGRNLDKVRRAVERAGLLDQAWYVERATMPGERALPLGRVEGISAPYFSLVMIPSRRTR